tara:strand:- start:193 stop:693 length:501 start_codon:yes stop_codon:yes gene_type:complete
MLTQKKLKEILHYDPLTGLFTWRVARGTRAIVGAEAGCKDNQSQYIKIGISGKNFHAHRLAWLYIYGEFPRNQTDHINHNREDNRIVNLRSVTCQENQRNMKKRSDNTSGHLGVSWHKHSGKWQVSIRANKKVIYIGTFDNIEDAVVARASASLEYGFHSNHGADK